MTILSVGLTQQGTSLSGDGDSTRQKRSYSANYIVKTDSATNSVKEIEAHFRRTATLPWYGRSWKWTGTNGNDSDPESICKKLSIQHKPQSEGIFDVSAEFEPIDGNEKDKERPDNGDGDKTRDPLDWREQVSVNYTQITVPVMLATYRGATTGQFGNDPHPGTNFLIDGRTYTPCNSALVPFDPLPEMEIDIKVLRFTRNIPDFDSNLYDPWIGTVNSDAVNINKLNLKFKCSFSPLSARIKSISGTSEYQNGVSFYRREIEIWVHPNGWRGRLADMGFTGRQAAGDRGYVSPGELDPLNNINPMPQQVILKDKEDYPFTQPQLLDGNGQALVAGAQHVWLNWSYYLERPWAQIVPAF